MIDVQALKQVAMRNKKQQWYADFLTQANTSLQDATRWLNQSPVACHIRDYCGWYEGKSGPAISRKAAYVLAHPHEEGLCVTCGKPTKLLYSGWAKTCCKSCAAQECLPRRVATNLKTYGVANPSQADKVKEARVRTFRKRFGCDNPFQNEEVKKKLRRTNLARLGVANPSSSPAVLLRKKENCLAKRGVSHWTQDPDMKTVLAETARKRHKLSKAELIRKYGVDQPMHIPGVAEKKTRTTMQRYGVPNAMLLPETRAKMRDSFTRKYGVDNPFKSEQVKRKIQNTCTERYGIAHPVVLTKDKKCVTDRHGKVHRVVGYEDIAIRHLDSLGVRSITSDPRHLPKIPYTVQGRTCLYYPDLGVVAKDGTKHLIEVKSLHTLEGDLKKNVAKFKAATQVCAGKATFWVVVKTRKGWVAAKNPERTKDLRMLRRARHQQ